MSFVRRKNASTKQEEHRAKLKDWNVLLLLYLIAYADRLFIGQEPFESSAFIRHGNLYR